MDTQYVLKVWTEALGELDQSLNVFEPIHNAFVDSNTQATMDNFAANRLFMTNKDPLFIEVGSIIFWKDKQDNLQIGCVYFRQANSIAVDYSNGTQCFVGNYDVDVSTDNFFFQLEVKPYGGYTTPFDYLNYVALRNGYSRRTTVQPSQPIGEFSDTTKPKWRRNDTQAGKVKSILDIITWLDVSANPRYTPVGNSTYCNIYGFDVCCLADIYFPRMWWNDAVIPSLNTGNYLTLNYGVNSHEMRANDIVDWFEDYGWMFGWHKVSMGYSDLVLMGILEELTDQSVDEDQYAKWGRNTVIQNLANKGNICVIVGKKRLDPVTHVRGSGHVCVVIPEHESVALTASPNEQKTADRNNLGLVTRPLTSQAGATNFMTGFNSASNWWESTTNFESYGIWYHT